MKKRWLAARSVEPRTTWPSLRGRTGASRSTASARAVRALDAAGAVGRRRAAIAGCAMRVGDADRRRARAVPGRRRRPAVVGPLDRDAEPRADAAAIAARSSASSTPMPSSTSAPASASRRGAAARRRRRSRSVRRRAASGRTPRSTRGGRGTSGTPIVTWVSRCSAMAILLMPATQRLRRSCRCPRSDSCTTSPGCRKRGGLRVSADAGRRAGEDDVAGQQRQDRRQLGDQARRR